MSRKCVRIAYFIFYIASLAVLITGFSMKTVPLVLIVLLLYSLLCLPFRKKLSTLFFIISILIGSGGILLKVPAIIMIIYTALSMVCWDLAKTEMVLDGYSDADSAAAYVRSRMTSLVIVIGLSGGLIFIMKIVRFKIPFWYMIALVILVFICLSKIIIHGRNKGTKKNHFNSRVPKNQ